MRRRGGGPGGGGAAHRPPHRHLNRHRRLDCQPGDRVAKQPLFCVRRYVVLRDRPRIRVRLEYSREPTSVGACALCRGSQQVSAQQDRSAGPVSGLERQGAVSPARRHGGRPLVSTSTRRHLFANLSMPVCAVKNSMRFKTQSILPYSMVLVRSRYTYFALLT